MKGRYIKSFDESKRKFVKGVGLSAVALGVSSTMTHTSFASESKVMQADDMKHVIFNFDSVPAITFANKDIIHFIIFTNKIATCELEYSINGQPYQVYKNSSMGLVPTFKTCHTFELPVPSDTKKITYRFNARECLNSNWVFELSNRIFTEKYEYTPINHDQKTTFSVFNDLHEKHDVFDKLLIQENSEPAQIMFLNGDLVTTVEREKQVQDFIFKKFEGLAHSPITHYVRGNHECRGSHAREMSNYLSTPNQGKNYYTFQHGSAQVMMLDTGEDKPDFWEDYVELADFEAYREQELEWIKTEIQKDSWTKAKFRIVIGHIPIGHFLSQKWISDSSRSFQARWQKVFHHAGVDLMLCGHTHKYEVVDAGYPLVVGGGYKEGTATRMFGEITDENITLTVKNEKGELFDKLVFEAKS